MRKISDIDCDNLFKSVDTEIKYQRMKRMAEWYEQRYFEAREELITLKLKLEIINKLSNANGNDIENIHIADIVEQGGET